MPNLVAEIDRLNVGIYPNPVVDIATISFNLDKPASVSFEVFNATGQLVYSILNVDKLAGRQEFNWNGTSSSNADVAIQKINLISYLVIKL